MTIIQTVQYLSPSFPLLSSLFIGICLILFTKTTSRLSKPIAFISISSFFTTAVISSILLYDSAKFFSQHNPLVQFNIHLIPKSFYIYLTFLYDKVSLYSLPILSILSILFLYTYHLYLKGKPEYVSYFVCIFMNNINSRDTHFITFDFFKVMIPHDFDITVFRSVFNFFA